MNIKQRRYRKYSRRVNQAYAAGRDPGKWLIRKWRAWHRCYKVKRLWP